MGKTSPRVENSTSHTSVFISMALDMSWRLALVVLIPIVGGFKLDSTLDTTPVLTITGFVLAMAGMGLVFWSTLQKANAVAEGGKRD
jgi:F0F1-type ATP synthase assembly protein I